MKTERELEYCRTECPHAYSNCDIKCSSLEVENKIADINTSIKETESRISEKISEVEQLKAAREEHIMELLDVISTKFSIYKGKKVKITFENLYGVKQEVVGFFHGFFLSYPFSEFREDAIYPLMNKVKKDGMESKKVFGWIDLASIKHIKKIELAD